MGNIVPVLIEKGFSSLSLNIVCVFHIVKSCVTALFITCILGSFDDMENVTISSGCSVTIDHYEPTVNEIERLDIKSYGQLLAVTESDATTTLKGLELDIRSGSMVCIVQGILNILMKKNSAK